MPLAEEGREKNVSLCPGVDWVLSSKVLLIVIIETGKRPGPLDESENHVVYDESPGDS